MKYKTISSFPDYEINCNGIVRRRTPGRTTHVGRILKINYTVKHGYPYTTLRKMNKDFKVYIHVAVAETFIGPKPSKKHVVAHNDGNPPDVYYKNLRWDTHKGNHADKLKHGTLACGESHGSVVLTERKVCDILNSSQTQQYLADKYKVARTTIQAIKSGKTWKHLRGAA